MVVNDQGNAHQFHEQGHAHAQFSSNAGVLTGIKNEANHQGALQGERAYQCDDGWDLVAKQCFQIPIEERATFAEAKSLCKNGSFVATVNDQKTEDAVKAWLRERHPDGFPDGGHMFWTGLVNTMNIANNEPIGPLTWLSGEVPSEWFFETKRLKKHYVTQPDPLYKNLLLEFDNEGELTWVNSDAEAQRHVMCSYNATLAQTPTQAPPTQAPSEPTPTRACDAKEGWTAAGGECYKFTLFEKHEEPNLKYTHDMAEELCHAMGSTVHLATINSDEANKVVADLVGNHTEVHIGLKYSESEKTLVWESGQPVKYEASWFNFTEAPGQNYAHKTDVAGECTRISGSAAHWNPSGWDDWPCTDALRDGYVCSFSVAPAPTPTKSPTTPPQQNCVVKTYYEWDCKLKEDQEVVASCETDGSTHKECMWGTAKGDEVFSVQIGSGCEKVTLYDDDYDGNIQNVDIENIEETQCKNMKDDLHDLEGDVKGVELWSKSVQ